MFDRIWESVCQTLFDPLLNLKRPIKQTTASNCLTLGNDNPPGTPFPPNEKARISPENGADRVRADLYVVGLKHLLDVGRSHRSVSQERISDREPLVGRLRPERFHLTHWHRVELDRGQGVAVVDEAQLPCLLWLEPAAVKGMVRQQQGEFVFAFVLGLLE